MIATVLLATLAIIWLTWPRPALTIRVDPGGVARVVTRFETTPLPDTIHITTPTPVDIRIENRDTVTHRLGMFAVARHHTNHFTISRPGVYRGYCSTHPGRELTYIVQ